MTRHYSKIDWWIMLPVMVILVYSVWAMVAASLNHDPRGPWWATVIYLLTTALIGVLSFPLYYEVSEGLLLIRSGIIRRRIPLDSIQSAAPSRSLRGAPALSLDRVKIHYQKGKMKCLCLVSPKNKEEFLNDLIKYSKSLKREGNRVVNFSAA